MKIRKQKKNQVNENLSTINVKDRKELSKLLERLNKMKIKSTIKRCLDENFRFTVTSVLNENYRGVPEIEFVWHGEWADPELIYKDETFNYWEVEDALWQDYLDENGDENDEDAFDKYVREHAVNMLDDWLSVREESLKESVEKDEVVYRGYRIFKCQSNGKYLIMDGKNYYGPDAAGFDSIKEAKKWLDKNRKEKGTMTESCHKELKENKDKSFSNSKYKKVISEYFDYTGDFDFLDIVATIIDRIDNFEDESDIQTAIEDVMIWYANRWEIMMFYQNPEDANFFDAYDELVSDIFGICDKIAKEDKEDEEDEEIEFEEEEVVEESCKVDEDTVKTSKGKWVNKGDSGETHGEFKTKKEADAQRKAMFAKGYKAESINEEFKLIADLSDYKPWSGAKETWKRIEEENKIEELDSLLDELYPEGLTMTELNDILWFESDWIYEMLDIKEESDEDEDEEIEEVEESCEGKECETIKIKPESKKVEVEIPDNSKVGEEGHPIKQGLKGGISKLEGLKEDKSIEMKENLEESTKVFEEQGTDEEIKQRYLKSLKEMYDFEPADLSEQELQDLRDAGLIK